MESGDLDCHELFLMATDLIAGNDVMTAQFDLFKMFKQEDDDEELL